MNKQYLQDYASSLGISKIETNYIIAHSLQISKTELFLLENLPNSNIESIKNNLLQRKKGVPIEYIIQTADFFGLEFFVDNRVLIPRNDTEVLVEQALKHISTHKPTLLLDIGTGSGAIPISICKNSTIPKALALDISGPALEVANINIANYQLENRLQTLESNLLSNIKNKHIDTHKHIVITANLPYIKNNDFENMSKETLEFEPNLALFGGEETGFELYELLLEQCQNLQQKYKIEDISLFIEIGFDQFQYSKNYLEQQGLTHNFFKDNNGINRCIHIKL